MGQLTDAEMDLAIKKVWDEYPHINAIPKYHLISRACHQLAVNYDLFSQQFSEYIDRLVAAGTLGSRKGRTGGIFRQNQPSNRITDDDIRKCMDKLQSMPAINDHICPCCGNDRVSKSERSCWKCGGSLHP